MSRLSTAYLCRVRIDGLIENATQACFALAVILDRDLHAWLMDNSKMKLVLEHELKPNE